MTFTPATLADRWDCTPEAVLALIQSKRLPAFTLSPPGSKRPRWRIAQQAVEQYERGEQPQPVENPARRRPRRTTKVRFYV